MLLGQPSVRSHRPTATTGQLTPLSLSPSPSSGIDTLKEGKKKKKTHKTMTCLSFLAQSRAQLSWKSTRKYPTLHTSATSQQQ